MKRIKLVVLYSVFLIGIICAGCVGGAVDTTEQRQQVAELIIGNALPVVQLDTLVAEKPLVPVSTTAAYSIDPRVGIEGEYYIFNIYTPHGTITAKGVAALVEYCFDAEVIEMLLSSSFAGALEGPMLQGYDLTNMSVVDAKFYAVDSIAGIGRRFNQEYSEDFDRDIIIDNIVDRNALFGAYADKQRATLAYRLGLDAYSANMYVQSFLDALLTLEQAELAGILEAGLVYPEINTQRGRKNIDATVQSQSLYPGSRSALIESWLINNDLVAIRSKLRQLYSALFPAVGGIEQYIDKLIASPHYSIREEVYIFTYLNDMAGVRNKEDIIPLLAGAQSAFEAKQFYLQLQLYHAFYVAKGLSRLVALSTMPAAIDSTGQILVLPSWDHTRDRIDVKKLLVEVKNLKDTTFAPGANIWFVGDCDKNTKKTAAKAGINIEDGVAMRSMFRFTTYRKLTYLFASGDPLVQGVVELTPESALKYQRTHRPVPTVLLADSENIAKKAQEQESTIIIEEPDKPRKQKHDPRNWREFGIGVKIIPKEELVTEEVPGIAAEGVGDEFKSDETGSGTGRLPPPREDPVKVDSSDWL